MTDGKLIEKRVVHFSIYYYTKNIYSQCLKITQEVSFYMILSEERFKSTDANFDHFWREDSKPWQLHNKYLLRHF